MNVNITATKQSVMIYPTLNIFLNGSAAAWLGNGEQLTLIAPEGKNEIQIKANMRSKSIAFESIKDVNIMIRWNRASGKIECLCNGPDVKLLR